MQFIRLPDRGMALSLFIGRVPCGLLNPTQDATEERLD